MVGTQTWITVILNCLPWKQTEIILSLLRFHPRTAFWNHLLADELYQQNEIVLNLASKEYSDCIIPYLNENRKMISCIFACESNGKMKVKGTEAKMLRGEMVRYMAERQIENLKEIKKFSSMGYEYDDSKSNETEYVWIKKC